MAVVSPKESELLSVARAVMGGAPFEAVQRLLLSPRKAPAHIGPTAAGLLKDMLGKGVVLALAKGGGALRDERGRLWERQKPARLDFGLSTVRLLQWLLEAPLGESGAEGVVLPETQGLGDELFLFSLLKLTQGTPAWHSVAQLEAARRSPLCALGFAFSLGLVAPLDAGHTYVWSEPALNTVDALQAVLERQWLRSEAEKATVAYPARLKAAGLAQQKVLTAFLSAIDKAGRRELAHFLVRAGARWLAAIPDEGVGSVVAGLSTTAPLRERQEARRAAAAPYRALVTLAAWDQEHRNLRFIDDGYAKAQSMVKVYDSLGERGFQKGARVLDGLENAV
jgi:hypothetical protein